MMSSKLLCYFRMSVTSNSVYNITSNVPPRRAIHYIIVISNATYVNREFSYISYFWRISLLFIERVSSRNNSSSEAMSTETAEKERADALVMTCRQHPSLSEDDVAALIDEAAKTYKKLGNRKALQDCHNVMTKFNKSVSLPSSTTPVI